MKWSELTAAERAETISEMRNGDAMLEAPPETWAAIADVLATVDALAPLVRDVDAIAWSHDDECPHRHGCDASCDGDAMCDRRFGPNAIAPCDCSSGRVLALVAALRPLIGGAK